jgi:hypothetical protein
MTARCVAGRYCGCAALGARRALTMEAILLALQGTLDVVSLADVLRLLAATAKTGQLRLENETHRGVVWLRGGQVTAVTDAQPHTDMPLVEFLLWFTTQAEGTFAFHLDDQAPHSDEPIEVKVIEAELAALAREWDELHQVVPSLNHRVGLVARLPTQQVTIDANRWPAILAAASQPTVQDLGARFGFGELDALRAARDLVSTGAAEVRPPARHETRAVTPPRSTDPRPTPAATAVVAYSRPSRPHPAPTAHGPQPAGGSPTPDAR